VLKDIAKAYETFQFAPQKPLLLPPEFLSTSYAGEMPDYLRPLIKPMEGTTVSTPMLHYSKQAGLTETDPSFYGTGIKGEEAARLGLPGAISPRTYFYADQNMEPEAGLGPHKYRAMGENLYDLAADPLQLQMLARETTRIPMTSTSNKGLAQPAEATNALERLIRDYGYAGYLSPRLAKPSVVMFGKTPVQPYAKGGKVRFTDNPDVQAMVVRMAKDKLPPGVKRATQQADKSALIASAKPARQAIQGYLGMDPSYSVMDPQAERLASAYRTGEATSVLGDLAGALSPFAYASALSKVGQVPGIAELIAYHGSPHKFKKFDASKIGTGEGIGAYGHGLYFAENPNVASEYRRKLSALTNLVDGDVSKSNIDAIVGRQIQALGANKAKQYFLQSADQYERMGQSYKPALETAAKYRAFADHVDQLSSKSFAQNKGSLYKVNIPDEKIAQMLDWDKPLSQQPKAVQEAINKSEYALRDMAMDLYGKKDPLGSEIARAALKPQEFAEHMKELGVPGIRYLDQGSRGTGKGTSNFVVFPGEEESIKMLEINGTPEMAKGGLVHMQDGGDPTARFMGKTKPQGIMQAKGFGEGSEDIEKVLQAIRESAPVSAASQLASGYMSGAGGTNLEKIGQAASMLPMIGLPATIGKASKLGKAVNVIGDVAQEASLANDYKAIPTAAFRREALAQKAAEQERLRLQAPKEGALQKTSVSVPEPVVKVEENPRVGNIASAKNFKAPQDKALLEAQRAASLPVDQGGLGLPPDNTPDMRAAAMGYQDFYHGTERLDRLLEKSALDPRRATSGPMPFGTESKQMASTYATSKRDTSRLAQDEGNVADYFTVSAKNLGYKSNQDIPVEKAFYFLPREKQQEIISKVKRIGYANPQEATGDLVLHPEGVGGSIMDPKTIDYYLQREAKGNPLTALRIMWHDSGTLYNNEEQLAKVFELAGFPYPISQKNAPWSSAQGVLTGKARLNNPLTTTDAEMIESRVIPALKQAFAKDRTRKQAYGPDQWAKNVRFTPKEWVAELEKDMAEGKNSYVWTSIPDKVTAELRKLGFDGIVDAGGKGGGAQHRVVIPFDTNQVRSRFAAFNPLKKDEPGLLKAKGGKVRFTDNPDVQAMVVKMAKELPKAVNKGKKHA